jgi:hypothetical protein
VLATSQSTRGALRRMTVEHVCHLFSLRENLIFMCKWHCCRSQWPRGLRRRSAAARLLRLWVRLSPGAWMFVCWECCVLSVRGLCDELITRPEKSYGLWCFVVCDLQTSKTRRTHWRGGGLSRPKQANEQVIFFLNCHEEIHSHPKFIFIRMPHNIYLATSNRVLACRSYCTLGHGH